MIFVLIITDIYLKREKYYFQLWSLSFTGAFVTYSSTAIFCQYKETLKILISLDLSQIIFFP